MSIENLATLQVNKLAGGLLGSYNALGFSTSQSPADALLSLAKNNVIPDIYTTLFSSISGASAPGDSQSAANDGTELDDRHKITIYSKYEKSRVICPIQEQVQIKVESNWRPFLPEQFSSAQTNLESFLQFFGTSSYLPVFTRRVWAGSKPLSLRIPLKFQAIENALFDVMQPVSQLMKMTLPKLVGNKRMNVAGSDLNFSMLAPPGPSPFREFTAVDLLGEEIYIYIGLFAYFKNVIITEVVTDFDSRLDASGYPISAKVDLGFETYEYWTSDQVDVAFKLATAPNVTSAVTAG